MIEVEQLTRRYGDHLAVDHLSFTAHPGEVVGLLGPNGAGKTTTMRMLTGFMSPTGGTARIAGYDVVEDSMAVRRSVGYLPERVPVYPDMTVRSYITFWAELRGVRRPRPQVDTILQRMHLTDRRDTLIRNLSKGMRQRLGLAQALVHDPQVVILDEPTIGIDPQQVIEVRDTIRELGQQHTVLFSTHILSEAEQICDRVVIIHRGRIVAEGSPDTLRQQLEKNATLYVQMAGASAERAQKLLSAIAGVETVGMSGKGFTIRASTSRDIRGEIASQVHAAGFTLLELRPQAMTLEEIFLGIIGREDR